MLRTRVITDEMRAQGIVDGNVLEPNPDFVPAERSITLQWGPDRIILFVNFPSNNPLITAVSTSC